MKKLFATTVFLAAAFANAQNNTCFFTFEEITEKEFNTAYKNNYNAPFVKEIADSTKLEKALEAIEKIYDEGEKELAESELCDSPGCLTSFEAYYPALNLYLFHILDYHGEKASFIFANTGEMASYRRFRGSFGVMSKDGLWVGLARGDCDNYLQLEVCKLWKDGVGTLFSFDFSQIDIQEEMENPIFWADKNTIYIAAHKYEQHDVTKRYYSIKFEY